MSAVSRFIRAVYGPRVLPGPPRVALVRGPRRRLSPWRRLVLLYTRSPQNVWLVVAVALTLVLIAVTVHYYNLLVGGYFDAVAARAKVDALMQRRNDLTRNLEQAVATYARHEATVFNSVTEKRAAGGGAPAGGVVAPLVPDGLPAQLGRLLAVAEQYPQLRLSENFQTVMQALIEVEKDLDTMRQRYVDAANVYTHELDTFPGNMFACIFGFRRLPFFHAGPEAQRLVPLRQ